MPKIIVLTGCTRGCGRALVDRFIEAGHTVVGCGRSESEIGNLQCIYPAPHRFDAIDVTDDVAVADWAKSMLTDVGTPDLLVNNAAVINRSANLWELSAAEFDNVIDINIKGVANTIRHFTPAMIKRQQGVIVNFSSGWGRSTSAHVAPYCATKFAVEGLSQAFAQELPEGMASVPLSPGVINTEMLQSCSPGVANNAPTPEQWSHHAAEFILNLSAKENGKSLSVN
ncbi:MAG: SDR family NAD(P)-dependent oxidoreductase [Planctomycetaceae bacterium]|jgi:NAD(P)-dependent dehydrogenase (short-subunit alcohol dehydrogenase family)|nr:SDR family oxidoreductase [bacterium]MDC0274534.1 SDR family oxidoreductase [Planctomycetaceae bacterium]MDG2390915.1 SDR family NAD(P)-dependent oxidoreductase [Planctomycetaceae bacterium]